MNALLDLLRDANVRWVLGGTFFLGVSSGILGSFALLRRRSLMGDVLAHAALPGVCLAFMLTQTRSVGPLLIGAVLAGLAGTWCVDAIVRRSRIKEDTAQALVLAVFFGFGAVLLTHIARSGHAGQSGLDRFLFGQAASLVGGDVKIIGGAALALTLLVWLLFKEFKLLCFDPDFAEGLGLPVRMLDRLLMLMIVAGIAIGLQAVGVVLMAALLITPAAAARYWTDRLDVMVILSGALGGLSGAAGTLLSLAGPKLSTGPLIVLVATAFFVVSLAFGARKGLLHKALQQRRVQRRVAQENLLRKLYEAAEKHEELTAPALAERLGWRPRTLRRCLGWAVREGLVEPAAGGRSSGALRLTDKGMALARHVVRRHRLWEMFLMYEADFAVDHVDRDADDIEHFLPPHVVAELERRLKDLYGPADVPPSVHPL
nr:manganese ABC transporter permease [Bacillota bacterium]